jgi:hypothetical protein
MRLVEGESRLDHSAMGDMLLGPPDHLADSMYAGLECGAISVTGSVVATVLRARLLGWS